MAFEVLVVEALELADGNVLAVSLHPGCGPRRCIAVYGLAQAAQVGGISMPQAPWHGPVASLAMMTTGVCTLGSWNSGELRM
jgi:hypothetical protein